MNLPYKIDWNEQWKLHAPNFKEGYVPIDLGLANPIKLIPGPGFGDFSHPTTQMMIKLLKTQPLNPTFIDIGSGSGILTLAALALGVEKAYGIEIEPDAVEHAKLNAKHNQLEAEFYLPNQFNIIPKGPITITFNMIRSEQRQAWNSLPQLHGHHGNCFASGVLKEEQESYLLETAARGWILQSTLSNKGWLAFNFKI